MVEIIDWHGKSLRVAIGTDHGGFSQKAELAAWLENPRREGDRLRSLLLRCGG
ncbi:MAG: hypothetical protein L6W00_13060 [Lentisphaeria bacterium]|nr:MAG: hypothetical protein L6W00_13060 [Lentisphaeria bacterium]